MPKTPNPDHRPSFSFHFEPVKHPTDGFFDVAVLICRPSKGGPSRFEICSDDLPEFERVVRQATNSHRKAVEEEKERLLRAEQGEITDLAIYLANSQNDLVVWNELPQAVRDGYFSQAAKLFAAGWRRSAESMS